MTVISHNAQPSFEETYPKAPFAELIRLTLLLAEKAMRLRGRLTGATPSADIGHAAAKQFAEQFLEMRSHGLQRGGCEDPQPRHLRRLGTVARGHDEGALPRRGAAVRDGQHAAHVAHTAVERELAEDDRVVDGAAREIDHRLLAHLAFEGATERHRDRGLQAHSELYFQQGYCVPVRYTYYQLYHYWQCAVVYVVICSNNRHPAHKRGGNEFAGAE